MTDRDDQTREIAYFLWLEAGCPEGQAERHWRDAEALLESDPEPFERLRIKGASAADPAKRPATIPGVTGAIAP
jgi:Protein of unknown function (DUF2934)